MKNLSLEFTRKRFEKALSYYGNKGIAPEASIIRIEEALREGKGKYSFNLKKENTSVTEKNLSRNDLFICTHLLLATMVETDALPGAAPLLTYGKLASQDDPNGFTNADIEALYNGGLYIKTGQTVNYDNLPSLWFRHVPQSGEFDVTDVALPLAEELVFAGTQDQKVEVNFPTVPESDFSAGEGTTSKVVFIALGYRIPGGTSETYKNDTANPYRLAI